MKYILIIFTLLSINIYGADTCDVELYSFIIYPSNIQLINNNDYFQKTNCSPKVLNNLISIIQKYDGPLRAKYIEKMFSIKYPQFNINISPTHFIFSTINNYLNTHLKLPPEHKIINANILNSYHLIKTGDNDRLNIYCNDCNNTGHKNIRITITNSKKQTQHTEWINALVAEKVKVLVTLRNIRPTDGNIILNNLKTKYIFADKPEIYFSTYNKIQFFRLNKSIKKGTAIKNTDVIPLNLVKYGHPSQIVFNKNGITLTGTAIPIRNGKFNELIRLKRKNKKIITGKVINFNKVKVEL